MVLTCDFGEAKQFENRMDALLYLSAFAHKYDVKRWIPIKKKTLIANLKRERWWAHNYPHWKKRILDTLEYVT